MYTGRDFFVIVKSKNTIVKFILLYFKNNMLHRYVCITVKHLHLRKEGWQISGFGVKSLRVWSNVPGFAENILELG